MQEKKICAIKKKKKICIVSKRRYPKIMYKNNPQIRKKRNCKKRKEDMNIIKMNCRCNTLKK